MNKKYQNIALPRTWNYNFTWWWRLQWLLFFFLRMQQLGRIQDRIQSNPHILDTSDLQTVISTLKGLRKGNQKSYGGLMVCPLYHLCRKMNEHGVNLISNQRGASISCILFVCTHLSALESTLSKLYILWHVFHCKWHQQSWNSTSSLSSNRSALSVRTAPDVSHMAMTMMTCDVWQDHRLSGLLTCALEL